MTRINSHHLVDAQPPSFLVSPREIERTLLTNRGALS
jgi:hypothetical protein